MHFPQVLHYAALHASLIFALDAISAIHTRDALVVLIGVYFHVSTTTYCRARKSPSRSLSRKT
jgi:hypothetical protein